MSTPPWKVEPLGDQALLLRFDAEPSTRLTLLLAGVAKAAVRLPEVLDSCPGMTTVLIETADPEGIRQRIPGLIQEVKPAPGTLHEVPVTYDGEDFSWACEHLGMDPGRLISLHSGETYDVRLLGSPGFVYLSDVPAEIAVPRLDEPRELVPAGSVGIAGRQGGIYGRARPGGWRLIARTGDLPRIVPGDRVRFVPR